MRDVQFNPKKVVQNVSNIIVLRWMDSMFCKGPIAKIEYSRVPEYPQCSPITIKV